jgi:hypothetical protein
VTLYRQAADGWGEPESAAEQAAAAGQALTELGADVWSQRPDLFPPKNALEFYRFFIPQTPNTGIYAPGTTSVMPVRLQQLIPAGFRFRVAKFSVCRGTQVSHQQAVAGYPNDEIDAAVSGLNPTELMLDGAPVAGMRRLFDNGGAVAGDSAAQAHDIFLRGRGPVTIAVRFSLNPQSVSWGTHGAWYSGWMWPSLN